MVAAGDSVRAGQLLAVSPREDRFAKHVCSPYNGSVVQIQPDVVVHGEPDVVVATGSHVAPLSLAPEYIVERAKVAGIVGMGGGAYPTHLKLTTGLPVDTVIVNGCESEPYLTCDARVLVEYRAEVDCGLQLAARAVGASRTLIANAHHGYPGGYEKTLVSEYCGHLVPTGQRPHHVGVIVINVQTARALHQAVCLGRPLLDRVVTVAGGAVGCPGNYLVPLGTEVGHVLKECATDVSKIAAVVLGGPMMGREAQLETTVEAWAGGVLALVPGEIHRPVDMPCIRCGDCLVACPAGLSARHLVLRPNPSLRDCTECGMCQYVCPAERPLVRLLRQAKAKIG